MESKKKGTLRGRSSRFFHLGDKPEDISPEGVHIYYLPTFPDAPSSSHESVVLKYGGEVSIPPKTYGLKLGFSWEAEGFDLDASAALYTVNQVKMDYIWWDNPKTAEESVSFTSNSKNADLKQVIGVELDHLPNEVCYIVLSVSVYSKGKTFKDGVKSLSIKGLDDQDEDKELFSYKIDSDLRGTTMQIGVLVRQGAWFKFVPLKQPLLARTVTEMAYEPANMESAFAIKAIKLQRRMMKLAVKKGKQLTPMDISLFNKRSDPYLKIFYRGKMYKSEVEMGTLAPKFKMSPLDIGEVVECDDDIIEIQIWDWDKLTDDDFMGMVRVCVGGMCQEGPGTHSTWLPVSATLEQKENNEKITGELFIEFSLVNLEDYDPRAEQEAAAAEERERQKRNVAALMEKSWRHA